MGELAEVTIQLPGETGVLIVPSAAIAHEGGQTGVWQSAWTVAPASSRSPSAARAKAA